MAWVMACPWSEPREGHWARSRVRCSGSPSRGRSMPASSASPRPSSAPEMARCISSTRPACRYSRIVATPPPTRTSLPPAAARARSSAASMPSVTKWNVVPPFIVSGARAWCVSTKTGTWYGGSSPHQPFHCSSGQGPRTGPNMLRPRIHAPMLAMPRAANSSSMPVVPLSLPSIFWKVRVGTNHSCNVSPPTPSGSSRL